MSVLNFKKNPHDKKQTVYKSMFPLTEKIDFENVSCKSVFRNLKCYEKLRLLCLQVFLQSFVQFLQLLTSILFHSVPLLVFVVFLPALWTVPHLGSAVLAYLVREITHVYWGHTKLKTHKSF